MSKKKQNNPFPIGVVIVIIAIAAFIAVASLAAFDSDTETDLPEATDRFFINDFADVMSDEDEQTVFAAGVALQEATGAQVVLATVEDIGDAVLEDYSIDLARKWGIGQAGEDNGILLLFTSDGPHSRIEIGYGAEGYLSDSHAGRLLDTYLVPRYNTPEEWSTGLTATYQAIVNVVYDEYGMTVQQVDLSDYEMQPDESGDAMVYLVAMLILFTLLVLLRLPGRRLLGPGFFISDHHSGGFGGGFSGGGFGGFHGGGGGFGGFHGGGGGFGGGGASR